jgi:hypothetical protein
MIFTDSFLKCQSFQAKVFSFIPTLKLSILLT